MMLCGIRILEYVRKWIGFDVGGIECGGCYEDCWWNGLEVGDRVFGGDCGMNEKVYYLEEFIIVI